MFAFKKYAVLDEAQIAKNCSGGNAKSVLVVLEAGGDAASSGDFLKKILAAVNLEVERDVCLCAVPLGATLPLSSLIRGGQMAKVLVFGLTPASLGINFSLPLYSPVQMGDHVFLLAHGLQTLAQAEHKVFKAQLWQCLKQMFLV